jgi:membrane fusion protein, multidrug efflux system
MEKPVMRSFSPIHFALLLAGALLSGVVAAGCQGEKKQPAASPAAAPLPQVAAVTIQTQPIMLTTELPGRTSAYRVAEIRPQVNGLIQKRLFTEGADVKAGDVLYQIDPATFAAALGNAEAALGRSAANLPAIQSRVTRYEELLAEKAVSQQDFDDAAAELKKAEADVQYWNASVETARINLAYTRITAPISGRIGRSNVTEGAIVTAYQPVALATIQQLDPIYVDVSQSTTDLLRLKRRIEGGHLNQKSKSQKSVTLIMEDGMAYPHEGSLKFRDVTVDPTTGSVILRVVVPNPDGFLLPGMFVRAIMKEGTKENAILVPQQAVFRDTKGNPVALIVDAEDKVQQRMLGLDRAIRDQWLVADGLVPGDRVVVEGRQKVRPGASVKVIPSGSDPQEGKGMPATGAQNAKKSS